MKAYEAKGWKWYSGREPTMGGENWEFCGYEHTCVDLEDGFSCASKKYLEEKGFIIISVDEAIKRLGLSGSCKTDKEAELLFDNVYQKKTKPELIVVNPEVVKWSDSETTYSKDNMKFGFGLSGEDEGSLTLTLAQAESTLNKLRKEVERYKKYLKK